MLRAFRTLATSVFHPTSPDEFREYYKGTYGMLFARPSKHVCRLLAVDREVLVLATSYTDLQPRVVQLATETIDGSDARLEHTVAIIMHRDQEGNGKLRNWGRELGLTVIPIYLPGYDLPSGAALERLLLSEFYSHDPFDVTGPVSDDNRFYGRRDEAQDIARHLQAGQVRACLGIRKIGKTSILHRVLSVTRDYHDCFNVLIDCSKDAVWGMRAGQLLAAIAEGIARAFRSEDYYADVAAHKDTVTVEEAHERVMAQVSTMHGSIVLLFDEVDYITPGSPTAQHWRADFNNFWRNLRAIHQEAARRYIRLSVMVSGVSSKWFRVESIDGIENAALAFIPEEYLSPLSVNASIAMVQSIGRTSGLLFDEDAASVIGDACSHIPFWIRKAGSYVHRHTRLDVRPSAIRRGDVEPLLTAFMQAEGSTIAELALSHLLRVYPELEPVAAAALAIDGANQVGEPWATILLRYGVIARREAFVGVSGPMMEAGLRMCLEQRSRSSKQEVGPSPTPGLRFGSVDEWAEELALIGAKRNRLEKRLRSMVVNFIRQDVLASKQRGSVHDRILKGIDDKRKEQWKGLIPDEIVEKFLWTELVRLIEREWSVFGAVFNDRAAFSLNAAIVNQRQDAHAKDADRADIASYRRALDWLEGCLMRI